MSPPFVDFPWQRARLMKPLIWIFQYAFGYCRHSHLSRVFTIEKRTYQVCFERGQKFDYLWTAHAPRTVER
jgi:hypothetical protein